MQDQDAPPVEEGETGGGAAVVPEADIRRTGPGAISIAAFTPRLWTTATAQRWPATMASGPDASGPALRRTIRRQTPSLCRCAKMRRHGFSASLTIFSFKRRF